ncbi:uncharacterized protein LOC123718041 isoform X1 [Pieris brassicae]|uniref:uncharacterized protein LOC123718041 isoform X1 n=1 Tax=Pieris brassicae TaxID=7116 RepID=UPI001E661FBE|nr:uncharacterized protein LOC123718041 isoform X1 [Pieris brassicae]
MLGNKRERCVNWEKKEKQLFKSILRPYISIIENKDLSTNINKEKMKAWSDITEKFNLANFRTRSKKQLMNQWKCIKLNTKKELSSRSNRFETSKTGGGQKPPAPSPDTMDVAEMIPQEFEDDFNEFDCDGVEDITNIIILGANDIPKENKANNDKDYMTKAKENHVKPNNKNPLKTPKTPMRTTPKASSNFSFGEASNADVHSIYALENERLQIEHEHRVKNMAEIHSQIMVNLKLQTEILMKTLESLKNK